MKNAVLRLMIIVITSISVVFLMLFTLRQLGTGQPYEPLNHPILLQSPLVVYFSPDSNQSFSNFEKAFKACPKCLLQVESRLSLDGVAFAFAGEDLDLSTNLKGYISLKTAEEIRNATYDLTGEPIIEVEALTEKLPEAKWLVNIHSRDASRLKHFLESLKKVPTKNQVALRSPFRQILKDARDKKPQWVYGTPQPYLMRIQMYESLFIETMASIWPDFLVFDPKNPAGRPSEGVIQEFLRRKKRVIVHSDSIDPKFPLESFGILTKDLDFAASLFDQ